MVSECADLDKKLLSAAPWASVTAAAILAHPTIHTTRAITSQSSASRAEDFNLLFLALTWRPTSGRRATGSFVRVSLHAI